MDGFDAIFARLRAAYARHAPACATVTDEPGRYYLGTHDTRAKDGYRTMFGGVEIKKAYVSAHLTPVYAHPELLDTAPDALRKRMQGKSCFHFKRADDATLADLEALIDASAARFAADGKLGI